MLTTKSTSEDRVTLPLFDHVYRVLSRQKSIDLDRGSARVLWDSVHITTGATHPMAEIGVFRGGSAKLMTLADGRRRPLLLFDTFTGMPPASQYDVMFPNKYKATDVNRLINYFDTFQNVIIYTGMIHESARKVKPLLFSIVHIDTACYQGTRDALKFFSPRMAPGGLILVQGVGDNSRIGVTRAVMEYAQDNPDSPVDFSVERYACMGLM